MTMSCYFRRKFSDGTIVKLHKQILIIFFYPHLRTSLLIFREKGWEREREGNKRQRNGEKDQSAASCTHSNQGWTYNPGMYPDWASNSRPFSLQDNATVAGARFWFLNCKIRFQILVNEIPREQWCFQTGFPGLPWRCFSSHKRGKGLWWGRRGTEAQAPIPCFNRADTLFLKLFFI